MEPDTQAISDEKRKAEQLLQSMIVTALLETSPHKKEIVKLLRQAIQGNDGPIYDLMLSKLDKINAIIKKEPQNGTD